mmetsp:Transcript_42317/g.75949  ORF Transcript_42317/g.75949 Transcript_42317/m.75949 type:complete len:217 (+) Transcript_42317:1597-2247(+)
MILEIPIVALQCGVGIQVEAVPNLIIADAVEIAEGGRREEDVADFEENEVDAHLPLDHLYVLLLLGALGQEHTHLVPLLGEPELDALAAGRADEAGVRLLVRRPLLAVGAGGVVVAHVIQGGALALRELLVQSSTQRLGDHGVQEPEEDDQHEQEKQHDGGRDGEDVGVDPLPAHNALGRQQLDVEIEKRKLLPQPQHTDGPVDIEPWEDGQDLRE